MHATKGKSDSTQRSRRGYHKIHIIPAGLQKIQASTRHRSRHRRLLRLSETFFPLAIQFLSPLSSLFQSGLRKKIHWQGMERRPDGVHSHRIRSDPFCQTGLHDRSRNRSFAHSALTITHPRTGDHLDFTQSACPVCHSSFDFFQADLFTAAERSFIRAPESSSPV